MEELTNSVGLCNWTAKKKCIEWFQTNGKWSKWKHICQLCEFCDSASANTCVYRDKVSCHKLLLCFLMQFFIWVSTILGVTGQVCKASDYAT